jgi:hypothetical protein
VVTLDEQVAAHGVERVAFLKIDTEGMELAVLAGATHTLARTSVIALETHERHRHTGYSVSCESTGFGSIVRSSTAGRESCSRRAGMASHQHLCCRSHVHATPSLLKRRSL